MSNRKNDHISLAAQSRLSHLEADKRFNYEPLLSAHPTNTIHPIPFLGKQLNYPIWVSSMTGGADNANFINKNLATICKEFGFGMGLGSCRVLLESDERWSDFDLRKFLGNEVPFFANLGIAQLEQLLDQNRIIEIDSLVKKLQCDGIIIHINPLQEAIQPNGDRIKKAPLETLKKFVSQSGLKIIVKEVGQGFGYQSLLELLKLPIEAIEFGAFGGTNFSNLEMKRRTDVGAELFLPLAKVGHSAEEMVIQTNSYLATNYKNILCKQLIISGGISNAVDGYYLIESSELPAIFGMGGAFLNYAAMGEEELRTFSQNLIWSYQLAQSYLQIKSINE